jgi:hypothetical protein
MKDLSADFRKDEELLLANCFSYQARAAIKWRYDLAQELKPLRHPAD